jgi:DNA-binding NarL/FixJ family response regulator
MREREMKIRLVIVDDHDILREGIKARLKDDPQFEIVGEGCDGEEAIHLYTKTRPDILLTDISMPRVNGLEAATKVISMDSEAKVIFLSVYDDSEYVAKASKIGAKGFILKDVSKQEMCKAIVQVARGGEYFSQNAPKPKHTEKTARDYCLTRRETEVLGRIAKGFSNKEIAADLALSVRTIESHRSSIRDKTGGGNAVALAKIAADIGL